MRFTFYTLVISKKESVFYVHKVSRNGANLDSTMRDDAIREMQNRDFNYVVMQARGRSIRPTNDIDGFLSDTSPDFKPSAYCSVSERVGKTTSKSSP